MQSDLPAAIKSQDAARVSVLRTTLAAVANAEAVDPSRSQARAGLLGDVERRELSHEDVRSIVVGERNALRRAAGEMRSFGQATEAADLATQAAILDEYLLV